MTALEVRLVDPVVLATDDADLTSGLMQRQLLRAGVEVCGLLDAQRAHVVLVLVGAATSGTCLATVSDVRRRAPRACLLLGVEPRQEQEAVQVLFAGADGYVPRPYAFDVLLRTVRAGVDGQWTSQRVSLDVSGVRMVPGERTVTVGGAPVHLSPTEFDVLHLLMRNSGRVVSVPQILSTVWGAGTGATAQTLATHVARLRRRLDPERAEAASLVQTVPRLGYRFRRTS